ncbi:MAG: cytochrome c-type biogenesis protein CcmH [Magnetococcales bacterium]|nr:cytochrome c-type biogenesis protein CcmH [Magnetococcales bacterium]
MMGPIYQSIGKVMLLAGVLLFSQPGWATELAEDPSEAQVRIIAQDLRCAVCQNQSIYESNSDLAKDMLEVIRDKVRAGEEEAAIRDYFFQRYGDYIYLEPTKDGMNAVLWFGPFIALGIGAWALWAALGRWRKSAASNLDPATAAAATAASPSPGSEGDKMQKRIEQELEKVDV